MNTHSLMHNNIENDDFNFLINFLKKKPKLTQSKKVEEFEKKWSQWLGVKYSVFVNSGSSSNLLSMAALKIINKNKIKNEIIVPSLTWSSDISSILHYGFRPVFIDINLNNLSLNLDEALKKINKKTLAVFITHAQGFNGLNNKFIQEIKKKKIYLIEDVCESHGAKLQNKKLGTFGLISNFSFYYAHHMTTIEGGMACTNNKKVYEILCSLRSHGLSREIKDIKQRKKIAKKYKYLSEEFIFLYPAYNVRNTEIGAVLGINQLKKLNINIKLRNSNLKFFLKNLDKRLFYTDFCLEGISNYALPVILNIKSIRLRNKLEKIMKSKNIEFRRGNAGGGNQLRQPYLKKIKKNIDLLKFKNVEHIHHFGYYIGNFPDLKKSKIKKLCNILNSLKK